MLRFKHWQGIAALVLLSLACQVGCEVSLSESDCYDCEDGYCKPRNNRRRTPNVQPNYGPKQGPPILFNRMPSRMYEVSYGDLPVIQLPEDGRMRNWGGGSCVHATTCMLFTHMGLDDWAAFWRKTYIGGEHASGLNNKMKANDVKFIYTTDGDIKFLEWAIATRRGAGITYWPVHCVLLVGLDEQEASILDNNRTNQIIKVPRQEFEREWKNRYGGWAFTLLYDPPPPPPVPVYTSRG